jgi:hypothetical protein
MPSLKARRDRGRARRSMSGEPPADGEHTQVSSVEISGPVGPNRALPELGD